jgi:hypothetical protein
VVGIVSWSPLFFENGLWVGPRYRYALLHTAATSTTTMAATSSSLQDETNESIDQYLSVIDNDPSLRGVSNMTELHAKLAELSVACYSEDVATSSVFEQLTFDGTNPNPVFEPNLFKRDVGCDGRKITTYYRYAIKSPEHVIAAVEFACDSTPSFILPASVDGMGPLFQGGFKAVGNTKYLAQNNVTLVVNTAKV